MTHRGRGHLSALRQLNGRKMEPTPPRVSRQHPAQRAGLFPPGRKLWVVAFVFFFFNLFLYFAIKGFPALLKISEEQCENKTLDEPWSQGSCACWDRDCQSYECAAAWRGSLGVKLVWFIFLHLFCQEMQEKLKIVL